jgi:hypothetical protein
MAAFYVLPPRALVGEWYAGYLQSCFPGLDWPSERWPDLAELLCQAVAGHADVYLVHREDLPPDAELDETLTDGFGAEPGDEVIEVYAAAAPGKWMTRRWRLGVRGTGQQQAA